MLPFLKPKLQSGVIISTRKPDEQDKDSANNEYIESCAKDLIMAVHAHDAKAAAEAIRKAFQHMDAEPHVEGEHIESEEIA